MRYTITLISCLLLIHFKAIAFKRFTVANGLSSNTVYNSYRDAKGFLWFATDKGVARFNGREFKSFTILDGISDNSIVNFHEDRLGRLWLFTYNGSSCFIYKDKVYNAANDPTLKKLPVMSFVRTMCNTDDDSTIYIGYRHGTVIKLKGSSVTFIKMQDPAYRDVSCLQWLNGKLKIIALERESIVHNDTVVHETITKQLIAFSYGPILLSYNSGIIKLYSNGNLAWQSAVPGITFNDVIKLYPGTNKKIYCCTKKGLYIIGRNDTSSTLIFKNIAVTSVCQDIYGGYWATTLGGGIYNFDNGLDGVQPVGSSDSANLILSGNGQLFCIKQGQLFSFNKSAGLFDDIHFNLPDSYIPLSDDSDHLVFYGGVTTRFLDKSSRHIFSWPGTYKTCYTYDKDKFLFVNNAGIVNISVTANRAYEISHTDLKPLMTCATFNSYNGQLYFVADNILFAYDPCRNMLQRKDSFPNQQTPVGIYHYRKTLIVLVPPNRFFIYSDDNNKRSEITTGNLAFFNLSDLGDGDFAAQTNNGAYLIQLNSSSPVNSRIIKIEYPFNESEIEKLYTCGAYIFCTIGGEVYRFHKSQVNKKLNKPVLFIDKITVNGKALDTSYYRIGNNIKCNISIQASTLSFGNMQAAYQYRIITPGETSQWFTGKSGEFNILLPDYDIYKIETRAVSGNGISSASSFLVIDWQPPFFLTWWFKLLAAIALFILLAYAVIAFNRRKQKTFQNELNYLQMEHKAINSLMNPHFIFNAINNIQDLVNKKETDDANDYLAMLSRLIRQNIENLQFSLVPLDKELGLVSNYIHLQNLRFGGKIKLIINNSVQDAGIYIPPLLIHTFVENAVVHGFSNTMNNFTITIDIHRHEPGQVKICIRDNGFGINHTRQKAAGSLNKTSLGISMTDKRLERLSQFYKVPYELTLQDLEITGHAGTLVCIIIYARFNALLPADQY